MNTEIGGDLLDRHTVFAIASDPHNIIAELLGVRPGHKDILPARPRWASQLRCHLFVQQTRIREALKGVELNLDEDELRRSQELFGRLVAREAGTGTEASLIRRFPALTLTTMVGHAGLSYEQRRYWDSFWDEHASIESMSVPWPSTLVVVQERDGGKAIDDQRRSGARIPHVP